MCLPTLFVKSEDYFADSLSFFRKYQHLFRTANTDIFLHNVLDEVNVENLENEEVFGPNFELGNVGIKNDFIRKFFREFDKFNINYDEFHEDESLENTVNIPLSQKKKHEIVYLAKEIKEICDQSTCDVVVDFGSGLGYLDQLLYETTDLKVLGIECNQNHYVGAKKRQRKHHKDSLEHVKYINHTINEYSDENIDEYVTRKFGKSNFCITGLHACADLTIDGVTLFLKMADAKGSILLPCCYHKMALDESKVRFKNFPLSSCLKRLFEENNSHEYMGVPFLRLAAQPPKREETLENLVFNLLARATLQLYAHKHGYTIKRNKRKAVRTKTVNRDFTEYCENARVGFTVKHDDTIVDMDVEELQIIWREIQKLQLNSAILILLQRILQPVIENFIMYDRLVYLKENGIKNCFVKKIFDENMSPKCLALISLK